MLLLVPCDVLRPRRPDEHFAAEAQAARDLGVEVALVDHDALARPGGAAAGVARVAGTGAGDAVYRGWMLDAQRYAEFVAALAERGVTARTGAGQYRQAHELPGWYPAMATVTPCSVWTTGPDRAGFELARTELAGAEPAGGPAVLRDYVKSMKHHWAQAAYIPDLADGPAAWRVAEQLRELRGEDFTGGYVLRRFEHFTGAEVRTWWVDGACRLVTVHPDTPAEAPPADLPLAGFEPLVAGLGLPFVTLDLVRRTDGGWRLVELGDGQVSDWPAGTAPAALIAALHQQPG